MMLTENHVYRTCHKGLQGNSELDTMEAGGGTPEPEVLKPQLCREREGGGR